MWIQETKGENGCGFMRPGLKKEQENNMVWSETGLGFKEPSHTPPLKILTSTLLPSLDVFKIRSPALSLRTGFPGALR